ATGNKPGSWAAELETLAFDPGRSDKPVDSALIERALSEARAWCKSARSAKGKAAAAGALLLVIVAAPSTSYASDADQARSSYSAALEITDRGERTNAFASTERMYRQLVATHPDRPELLTDWGNAALGACDLGTAV